MPLEVVGIVLSLVIFAVSQNTGRVIEDGSNAIRLSDHIVLICLFLYPAPTIRKGHKRETCQAIRLYRVQINGQTAGVFPWWLLEHGLVSCELVVESAELSKTDTKPLGLDASKK